jgi:hypothetical protein
VTYCGPLGAGRQADADRDLHQSPEGRQAPTRPFDKHIIEQGEFPGATTPRQFADIITDAGMDLPDPR